MPKELGIDHSNPIPLLNQSPKVIESDLAWIYGGHRCAGYLSVEQFRPLYDILVEQGEVQETAGGVETVQEPVRFGLPWFNIHGAAIRTRISLVVSAKDQQQTYARET